MKKLVIILLVGAVLFVGISCTNYNYDYLYWWMAQQEAEKPTAEEAAAMGGDYIDSFDMNGISSIAKNLLSSFTESFDLNGFTAEYKEELFAAAGCTDFNDETSYNAANGKILATLMSIKLGKDYYSNVDNGIIGQFIYTLIKNGELPNILTTTSGNYTLTVDDINAEVEVDEEKLGLEDSLIYILKGIFEPSYEDYAADGLSHADDTKYEYDAPITLNATLSVAEFDPGLFAVDSGYQCKGDFDITVEAVLHNVNPYGDYYLEIQDVYMSTDGPLTIVGADGTHNVSLNNVGANLGWIIGKGDTFDFDFNGKFIKEILGGTLTIDGRTIDFIDAVLESSDAGVVTE